MGLPKKLVNLMLFNEGEAYLGTVESVTRPKLSRKTEEWQGGGMNAPLEINMGLEALTMEWQVGGFDVKAYQQFGETTVGGLGLRFVGAHQRADTGDVDSVEIIVRGYHKEVDGGEAKTTEGGATKVTSTLSYYKLVVNDVTEVEIDVLGMVESYRGNDVLAAIRDALGI
jgi:uncharacterized protein